MKRTCVHLGALVALGFAATACAIVERMEEEPSAATSGGVRGQLLAERRAPSSSVVVRQQADKAENSALSRPQATLNALPLSDLAGAVARQELSGTVIADPGYLSRPPELESDRERYQDLDPSPVKLASEEPVSTFSIDVDTAAYANVRRFLKEGALPPVDAVRVEELINYFDYDYVTPNAADAPFATDLALFDSPWDPGRQLLRIGIRGYDIDATERPPANLVFLVDTSGSMASPDKLPLLQQSLRLLVERMRDQDRIAIVSYAGRAGIVLEPTSGAERDKIVRAIKSFHAGGSTAGADGIVEAYRLAEAHYEERAVNRVILATDGDFNVGVSDPARLEEVIAAKRETGVYLSILAFGRGNLNDRLMQTLAQAGNGNASYIDGLMEAQKVLVDEMASTLFPIADDVKIQIEFNPKRVAEYRLIGYESRMLLREDFNNDHIDAGDIGSGHRLTALYEITPVDSPSRLVDDLRYGVKTASLQASPDGADEVAWLRLRYKRPGENESSLIEQPVSAAARTAFEAAPADARFAAAVAAFGEILRQSPYVGAFDLDAVLEIARPARGEDPFGYRHEFLQLVRLANSARALGPGRG